MLFLLPVCLLNLFHLPNLQRDILKTSIIINTIIGYFCCLMSSSDL